MKIIITFILLLTLTGCAEIDEFLNMKPLEIENFTPSEKRVSSTSVNSVKITFSEEMMKSRTENSFSLKKNSSPVHGAYSWEGKTLVFTPFKKIELNYIYQIELTTKAEDTYGNSLPEKFIFKFSTAQEDGRPSVLSSTPADRETITDPLHPVAITFTEAVESQSLYSAFSIFPDIDGYISLANRNTEVIFTPLEKYENGSDYTVSISDKLKDQSGNRIADNYELFFSMEKGVKPDIIWFGDSDNNEYSDTAAVNQNIEKGVTIRFILDSEASEEMKSNPAAISPQAPYKSEWNTGFTECLIIFDNPLLYDEIHEIEIDDKLYRLHINGSSSKPPSLEKAVFCSNSSAPVFEELTLNKGINFQTSDETFFDFYFKLADSASLTDTVIFNSITFRTVNGDLSVNPLRVINPAASASPAPSPSPLPDEYIVRIECSVTAGTQSSPFIIEIGTELEDTLSNTMTEDAVIQVNSL